MDYSSIPQDRVIEQTAKALRENNIDVFIVNTKEEAREKILTLIPQNAEVMNMTSVTLDQTGIVAALEDGSYDLVKNKLSKMNRETDHHTMQQIGAAPEYAIGSVHAVTHDGKVLIASNTGSQLPAYAYGADHVIWVVGAQKIVKDLENGIKRIYEYTLPLESERAHKAYGVPGSFVSKLLVINKEQTVGRIQMIIVHQALGF